MSLRTSHHRAFCECVHYLLYKRAVTLQDAASEMGVNGPTLRYCYDTHLKPQYGGKALLPPSTAPIPIGIKVSADIRQQREAAERKAEIAHLKSLQENQRIIEDLRQAIRETCLRLDPPNYIVPPHERSNFENEEEGLILSDIHVGMGIESRLNAGWEYRLPHIEAQFEKLATGVLRFREVRGKAIPVNTLTIFDLGDDVEGDNMRNSQHRIIDMMATEQTGAYAKMLAGLVMQLLRRYKKIRLLRVPGNHGRTTQRAGLGGGGELDPVQSYDWLAGLMVAQMCSKAVEDGRLEIINHRKPWGVTEMMGHTLVYEHGASISASQSFAGLPFYGFYKAAARYQALIGRQFSFFLMGHWHQAFDIPAPGLYCRVMGNGAFPPTTPYIANELKSAAIPCQTLFSVHPDKARTLLAHVFMETGRVDVDEA